MLPNSRKTLFGAGIGLIALFTSPTAVPAQNWSLTFDVSIADSRADGGRLFYFLTAGTGPETTDGFDNAADVVALLAGPLEAAFSHSADPAYPSHLSLLWRDVRAPTFPQKWLLQTVSFQSASPVTLSWTPPPVMAGDGCSRTDLRFEDLTTGRVLDLYAGSHYSFLPSGSPGQPETRLFELLIDRSPESRSSPPALVSAKSQGPYIMLRWRAARSGEPVLGYHVWRSRVSGGGYERLTRGPVTQLHYFDKNTVPGTVFHYVLTSVDSNGCESAYSMESAAAAGKHGK